MRTLGLLGVILRATEVTHRVSSCEPIPGHVLYIRDVVEHSSSNFLCQQCRPRRRLADLSLAACGRLHGLALPNSRRMVPFVLYLLQRSGKTAATNLTISLVPPRIAPRRRASAGMRVARMLMHRHMVLVVDRGLHHLCNPILPRSARQRQDQPIKWKCAK